MGAGHLMGEGALMGEGYLMGEGHLMGEGYLNVQTTCFLYYNLLNLEQSVAFPKV